MSLLPAWSIRVYRSIAARRHPILTMVILASSLIAGCTPDSTNPRFAVTGEFIDSEWSRLRAQPAVLERPLVVLGGYRSPSLFAGGVASDLRRLTGAGQDQVLAIGYPFDDNFPTLARRVVDAVEKRWPSDDPDRTIEVDVVGLSMGGLVARAAAASPHIPATFSGSEPPLGPPKALRIRRLFTLGTPHRGALLAETIALDPMAIDMKPGSGFLAALNAKLATSTYELICYARTRDDIVGATNAAPPGREPIWVEGPRFFSHHTTHDDRRFLVDIARRLRGETPLGHEGEAPPRD